MKRIGIIPLYDDEKQSYWMVPGYMQMLEDQGAAPLMLPLTKDRAVLDEFLGSCGGFLFTGGHDVDPSVYREAKKKTCGLSCPLRDEMEGYLLKKAVEADLAVFGICRGIQFLNASFGGTLYQDLPSEYESTVEHHMCPPYDRAVHRVQLLKGTPLYDLLRKEDLGVNSYHHQAIRELASCFEPMAISEDGLVEAIYLPGKKFVQAVQWHPEFSYKNDPDSVKLIRSFVDAV